MENKPELLVGEIITNHAGIEWKRTNIKDKKSMYKDNYYYMPMKCFCDVDCDGAGYTYMDEYGSCDRCTSLIRQINGHNDGIKVYFYDVGLFE